MLKHRYPRVSGPMRGSILDDDSNLMHYQGGTQREGSAKRAGVSRDDDYEEVDSNSGEEWTTTTSGSTLPRRRSESDLLKSSSNLHCYDEMDGALFNGSTDEISPYCVGPVVLGPRSKRFGSTASRISQDSGAFCDEVPPPLPRKPRSVRRRYANIFEFESPPPPLPPRKSERVTAPPPPLPSRTKSPSPLHLNLNLPGLNPVGRKNLSQAVGETSKKAFSRRRRTLHNFDSNKENSSLASSPPSVSTKKKFKIFGSKAPLSVTGEDVSLTSPAPSPRRRKLFRHSLLNASLRKKKVLDPSLSTPIAHRRRSSLKFGSSTSKTSSKASPIISPLPIVTEPIVKSEEIIKSSEDEDFSNCIRDAIEHGLPIIPFQSSAKYNQDGRIPSAEPPVCCCHSSSCHNNVPPVTTASSSTTKSFNSNTKKSLENIVGEAQKEMEDEEKRLLNIMMKHADLLLTPKLIREALKKNKSSGKGGASSESDSSEEEISEYLEMNRLPGRRHS